MFENTRSFVSRAFLRSELDLEFRAYLAMGRTTIGFGNRHRHGSPGVRSLQLRCARQWKGRVRLDTLVRIFEQSITELEYRVGELERRETLASISKHPPIPRGRPPR